MGDILLSTMIGFSSLIIIWGVFVGIAIDKSKREFKRFSEEADRKHKEFKKGARKRFESFQRGGGE